MATIRQRKAIANIAENGGVVSRAMLDAGYSPMTAQDPKKLTESKGYKELCEQHGLTPDLILASLVDDIKAKPKQRVGEMRLGADIIGMTKQNNTVIPIQINFGGDKEMFA